MVKKGSGRRFRSDRRFLEQDLTPASLFARVFTEAFSKDPELALDIYQGVQLDQSDTGERLFEVPNFGLHVFKMKAKLVTDVFHWIYVPATLSSMDTVRDYLEKQFSHHSTASPASTPEHHQPLQEFKKALEELVDLSGPA